MRPCLIFIYSFMLMVVSPLILLSQAPNSFNYQAIVRDNSGNPISNKQISIRISILQGNEYGTFVFVESHATTTNKFGLITLNIGAGNIITGSIESINWANGPYWLKLEVDLVGGSNYSELGTTQLLSVPYALHSKTSENAFSGDYNELSNRPDFSNWDNNINDDFSGDYADLINKPNLFSGSWNDLTNKPNLAVVATSGSFSDLINKPTNLDINYSDDVLLFGDQTINGSKAFNNTILANNGINASNKRIVSVGDPINDGDAINKKYFDALISRITVLEEYVRTLSNEDWFSDSTGIVRDIEGNIYDFGKIGNQIWMFENLTTSKFANGDPINTTVPANLNISGEDNPQYQWIYGGNDQDYLNPYGRLYTWYVVNDPRSVCPSGWRVPSAIEFSQLVSFLGGSDIAGGKLKEMGFSHWLDPNTGATDSYGFGALPGGYRSHAGANSIGGIQTIGIYGFYWTSSSINDQYANSQRLENNYPSCSDHTTEKNDGISIRCIRK